MPNTGKGGIHEKVDGQELSSLSDLNMRLFKFLLCEQFLSRDRTQLFVLRWAYFKNRSRIFAVWMSTPY